MSHNDNAGERWENFIKAVDDLEVGHVLDEDEIISIVRARHEDEEIDEEEDDDDDEPISTVTETAML